MLEVRDLYKTFEGRPLLMGVSFSIQQSETVCLLGASGSGKSTILRIIAGLEIPESGQVLWNGKDMAGVPVHERNFGLMFQDYALFPHRSVAQNVAFGLRMRGVQSEEIKPVVQEMLDQVNLRGFENRRVTELSGGEQQRVALARALAHRPGLLMLDEPLGALDRALRAQLTEELRHLLHQQGIPALYVTHDQEEAFAIADRIILLNEGRVEQSGSPMEVYSMPKSVWAARFFGLNNLIMGKIIRTDPLEVQTEAGLWRPGISSQKNGLVGQPVTLLLRPSAAQLMGLDGEADPAKNMLSGVVVDSVYHGDNFSIELECDCGLMVQVTLFESLPAGKRVRFHFPSEGVLCL